MKKLVCALLSSCLCIVLIGSVAARDVANPGLRPAKAISELDSNSDLLDPGLRGTYFYKMETESFSATKKLVMLR